MVKRKFFTSPSDPFVTSDVSDAQNCGKNANSSDGPSNPFVTSDVSDVQNCGKMDIFDRTKPDYGEKLR